MSDEWVHLATAPDQITAEIWIEALRDQGIAARMHPSDAVSFLGIAGHGCRIQVPAEDLERAQELVPEGELER